MIHLFTDFGLNGPYVGQMHAAIATSAPETKVVDLMHDAPRFNPGASAYLLAALARHFSRGDVCIAVVDPGVGTDRRPVAVEADGIWFVGPDNGLFEALPHTQWRWHEIVWRPEKLSNSFHGRDLFSPVGAALAKGTATSMLTEIEAPEALPTDLQEIIYIDDFGNAMTGIRAETLDVSQGISVNGHACRHGRTFGEQPVGTAFWYENSLGLVELSLNQGNAATALALEIGTPVSAGSCK